MANSASVWPRDFLLALLEGGGPTVMAAQRAQARPIQARR